MRSQPLLVAALAALAALAMASSPARAQTRRRGGRRVRVEVVEVAGEMAYVTPGADAGLSRGDRIVIQRQRHQIAAVTAGTAAFRFGEQRPDIGDRGVAFVRRNAGDDEVERLTAPEPLSAFRSAWPEAVLPASRQHPEHVPLGVVDEDRRLAVVLSAGGAAFVPLGGEGDAIGRGEVRARVHAEPFESVPFALDADAAFQFWAADNLSSRPGAASQPYVRVRELALSYGDQADFFASLGRLRYAATTIGQLDGVRIQSPSLSGFTAGAFGGFLPNPLDGAPEFSAARFGLELAYRAPEHDLRPMVAVVGSGSTYDGNFDERRISAVMGLYPGDSRIGGHAEVSFFDPDNPWNAGEVELTALGFDGTARVGGFHAGARVDLRRPERSLRLASYLPASWLCARQPGAPGTPPENEACGSLYEPRYLGSVDLGYEIDWFAVTAGGTAIHVGEQSDLDQLGGWLNLRAIRIFDVGRADLTAMASTGLLIETFALRLELGVSVLGDALDISVHYRPALTRYDADLDRFLEHMAGGSVLVSPLPTLDLTLDVDALTSRDVDALLMLANVIWRANIL